MAQEHNSSRHGTAQGGTAWDGMEQRGMGQQGTACHSFATPAATPTAALQGQTRHSMGKATCPWGGRSQPPPSPTRTGHTRAPWLHGAVTQRVPARGAAGWQLRATPLISFTVFLKAS